MNDNVVGEKLYLLAKVSSSTILTFQGYEINGNTFYTIAQDKKSTNQNSGVRFDAATSKGQKDRYYGYIEVGVKTERIQTDSSETVFVAIFFSESKRTVCRYE
jgi:hypothetical protein